MNTDSTGKGLIQLAEMVQGRPDYMISHLRMSSHRIRISHRYRHSDWISQRNMEAAIYAATLKT